MVLVKKLFSFYVRSNIHVSLSFAAIVLITGFYFDRNTAHSALFLSVATFVGYNVIKYLKWREANLKESFFKKLKTCFNAVFLLTLGAFFWLLYSSICLDFISLCFLVPFVLLTIFYMLPVYISQQKRYTLRNIPGFKIVSISLSWSGLSTLFVFYTNSIHIETLQGLFFIHQFLFVLVLTIPFDLRDLNLDSKELRTLPMLFGEFGVKLLGSAVLVFMNILGFLLFERGLVAVTALISVVLLFFLWNASSTQKKYYASFWIESIPIIWLFFTYIYKTA